MKSKLLQALGKSSILDLIPGLSDIASERGRLRLVDAGERIQEQGQLVGQLVIPVSEHVRLIAEPTAPGGEPKFIGYLQRGRSLCIKEILSNQPAAFSAVAESATSLFVLPVADFLACLNATPEVRPYLEQMTNSRGARALRTFLLENNVPNSRLFSLFAHVQPATIDVAPGEQIPLLEPALFLVDSGSFQITSTDPASTGRVLAELGDGAWFGGVCVVPPHTFNYAATATSASQIKCLRYHDIAALLEADNLIDLVVRDPWVSLNNALLESEDRAGISDIPGEVVGYSQLLEMSVKWDPQTLVTAESDADSVVASLRNLALISGLTVNAKNLESDLRIATRRSYLEIADSLEAYGLLVSPIKTAFNELPRQHLPALIGVGPRMMVLVAVRKKVALLIDPCRGAVAMLQSDLERSWDRTILEIDIAVTDDLAGKSKVDDSMLDAADPSTANKSIDTESLMALARPVYKMMFRYPILNLNRFLFGLAALGVGAVAPKLSQYMIDEVLTLKEWSTIAVLSAGTLLILVIRMALTLLNGYVRTQAVLRFDGTVSELFYRHALSAAGSGPGANMVSDIQARSSALGAFKSFLAGVPEMLIMAAIQVIFYSALLLNYDLRLAATCLAILPATILLRFGFRRVMMRSFRRMYELGRWSSCLINEQIASMATLKATNSEDRMRHLWEEANAEAARLGRFQALSGHAVEIVMELMIKGSQMLGLYLGVKMVQEGRISLGEVMAVNMYVGALIQPLTEVASVLTSLEGVKLEGGKVLSEEEIPTALVERGDILKVHYPARSRYLAV